MRKVIGVLFALILGWASVAQADPAVVQAPAKCTSATAVGTKSCSFSSNVTAGNLVIVTAAFSPAPSTSTIFTPTDTAGNSYQLMTYSCTGAVPQVCLTQWSAIAAPGGFTTVSVTQSTAAKITMDLLEVSGVQNPAMDTNAKNLSAAGGTSFSSGTTITTTTDKPFVVAALAVDVNLASTAFTIAGGWTERARETDAATYGAGISVVTKNGAALSTYEHTWTSITTQGPPKLLGLIVAYKATPGGGANTLPTGCTLSWSLGSETDLMGYYVYIDLLAVTLGAANRHDVGFVTSATCASLGINTDGTYHTQLSAYDTSRNESTKVNPAAPYATSFALSGTSGAQTLAPPTITAPVNGVDPTQALFTWAPVTGAAGYIANVHETSQASVACNPASPTPLPNFCIQTSATSFNLDLLPSTAYNWFICTLNGAGVCGLTSTDSFTTGAATSTTVKTITWSWSGLDASGAKTDISGFRIQRSSSLTGTWTLLDSVGPTVRSYLDAAPLAPVSCYRIDVVNINQTITIGPTSSANCVGTGVPTVTTPPSPAYSVEVQ